MVGLALHPIDQFSTAKKALVVRLSNEADEYVIADAVRLEWLAASPVQVRDDGDPGFFATDAFFSYRGQGYQDDVTFAGPGSGTQSAAWTFAVTPGTYRISATWTAHPNRATDAPFFILDGSMLLGAVSVNQERVPDDFSAKGSMWEDLGSGVFTISSGTLTVLLTDLADEYVIADAIRIERLA